MCITTEQVFHFVSSDIFNCVKKQMKSAVLDSINATVFFYKEEITNLLCLILPGMAEGFSTQRGKIFGFGPAAEKSGMTFKVSTATEEEMQKLNSTAVHNLGEERSVGNINYELAIRGKRNLEASSKKLLLNKSFDLLEKSGDLPKFQSFRTAAQDIKLMKIEKSNHFQ